jgi:hypothetical protein
MRRFSRSRSARRTGRSCDEAEQIKARLSPFGETSAHNPVKDQIADLQGLRDRGAVSASDYAARVADLLGTPESALG